MNLIIGNIFGQEIYIELFLYDTPEKDGKL